MKRDRQGEGQGTERGRKGEGEGMQGEGKGFAGPVLNCFLRACIEMHVLRTQRPSFDPASVANQYEIQVDVTLRWTVRVRN